MSAGLLRPQPLGVLGFPAGAMVVPDVDGAAAVVAALVRGEVPTEWPEGLTFYGAAARGDLAAAQAALQGCTDDLARLNAFALDPTGEAFATLSAELDAPLLPLLQAAAFTAGIVDLPPPAADADAEVRGYLLLTAAAEALEHGRADEARALLVEAAAAARDTSPALAASLLGTLGGFVGEDPLARHTEALALLPTGAQTQVRAELLYGRGVALQSSAEGSPWQLREAVRCYQQALVVFRRETHPELFAEAQTNLALCHLATPMVEAGDHLRLGIAVQALRDALTVWTPEEYPQQWASVTLNLANALQYLPSAHQGDNLVEAVERYEQLLALRDPETDPVGFARVLANQGNALAHLGISAHARTKLAAAQALFAAAGETGAASSITTTLDELDAVLLLDARDREPV